MKLKFDRDTRKYSNGTKITFLQLDSTPINEALIKDEFFASNKSKFRPINPYEIKFSRKVEEKDLKILHHFFSTILTNIIINSNLLWTSSFILNEINHEVKDDERIKAFKNKETIISLANCPLIYFKNNAFDQLILSTYHFWYESKQDEINWRAINNILRKYLDKDVYKNINNFVQQNIFKNPELKQGIKNNQFDKIKDYRNSVFAHVKFLENGERLRHQIKDDNLLHLSNCIKIIATIFADSCKGKLFDYFTHIFMCPNLFFVAGGSTTGETTYSIKPITEIRNFYFIPQNWGTPYWF